VTASWRTTPSPPPTSCSTRWRSWWPRGEKYRADDQAKQLVPAAQQALSAMDALHQGMLMAQLLEESAPEVPVEEAKQEAVALGELTN
jgi:hypothetical protein